MAVVEQQEDKEQEVYFNFMNSLKARATKESYNTNIKLYLKFCGLTKLSELLTIQKSQKQIVRVARKWRDVSKYILDKTGYEVTEGKQLPAKMLEDAIIFNCGNDDRTVRSWINKFIFHEYIKLTRNPLGYEVVKAVSIPDFNKEELR